jgi:hypothetical protein
LWLYEEHLAKEAGVGATVDEHERNAIWRMRAFDSIEHVFPKNPFGAPGWNGKMRRGAGAEEYPYPHVDRIGNLILLPVQLNQEAQRKPFAEKKEIYGRHNLRMVREVSEENDWTLSQIEEREGRIIEWAKAQWCDL